MIPVPVHPAAHAVIDLAAWGAGLGAGYLVRRWRPELGKSNPLRPGYYISLATGAVAGGWLAGSLNTLALVSPSLSHSVAGALVGAIIAVEAYKLSKGLRGSTGGQFTASFAVGIVIGRWGCLLSGLNDQTYGVATRLSFGVDLGDGISRHPVQIYESLSIAAFLAVYMIGLVRRSDWAMRRGFYVFCAWYGLQRFAWEWLKPYPQLIGPFNLFHILCLGLVVYGCVFFTCDWQRQCTQERALSLPGSDDQSV